MKWEAAQAGVQGLFLTRVGEARVCGVHCTCRCAHVIYTLSVTFVNHPERNPQVN